MVGTRWESSNSLFIRTVWKDGHHHVLFQKEEVAQTIRSGRRTTSSRIMPPPAAPDRSGFKVPSVKLLLATLRTRKTDPKMKKFPEKREFVKSAVTVDVIPSDTVRLNDLNRQVSFTNEKKFKKARSVEVQQLWEQGSGAATPPPFSYTNYCVDSFNTTLSERVMIWLDLAVTKNSSLKTRVMTAPPPAQNPPPPVRLYKTETPLVTSQMEFDDVPEMEVRKVRPETAKRQLHIFLPNLPKKCSDSGSFLSTKSSSNQ